VLGTWFFWSLFIKKKLKKKNISINHTTRVLFYSISVDSVITYIMHWKNTNDFESKRLLKPWSNTEWVQEMPRWTVQEMKREGTEYNITHARSVQSHTPVIVGIWGCTHLFVKSIITDRQNRSYEVFFRIIRRFTCETTGRPKSAWNYST